MFAFKRRIFGYDKAVRSQVVLAILLLIIFAFTRWPGLFPQNFSAVYALVFCGGLFLKGKLGLVLPMVILLATDLVLNIGYYGVDAVHPSMLGNYIAYAAILFIARKFKPSSNIFLLLLGSLSGAILFYLVTNFAAWLQNPEYTKDFAGLIKALTLGTAGWPTTIEFFRNTLGSTGLFTALFASVMKFTEPEDSEAPEPVEEAEPAPSGEKAESPT